jgi:hypothetical protein
MTVRLSVGWQLRTLLLGVLRKTPGKDAMPPVGGSWESAGVSGARNGN